MPPTTIDNAELSDDAWQACPPGALSEFASHARARDRHERRATFAKNAAVIGSAVAAFVVAVGLTLGQGGAPEAISCGRCFAHFDAYAKHIIAEKQNEESPLDAKMAERIAAHLTTCERCQPKFEMRYPGLLDSAGLTSTASKALPLAAVCRGTATVYSP